MTNKIAKVKKSKASESKEPIVPRLFGVLPKKYHDLLLEELSGVWAEDKTILDHFRKLRVEDSNQRKKTSRRKEAKG